MGFLRGEQGWRSGESTRLPPLWPGFDSRTRRHMWVEFVVGSRPCSEGFSPGTPVFLPPQKPTFQIPIRPGNSGEKSHSVDSTEISIHSIHSFKCKGFSLSRCMTKQFYFRFRTYSTFRSETRKGLYTCSIINNSTKFSWSLAHGTAHG